MVDRCLSRLASEGIQRCSIHLIVDNESGAEFWRRIGWRNGPISVSWHEIYEPFRYPCLGIAARLPISRILIELTTEARRHREEEEEH